MKSTYTGNNLLRIPVDTKSENTCIQISKIQILTLPSDQGRITKWNSEDRTE